MGAQRGNSMVQCPESVSLGTRGVPYIATVPNSSCAEAQDRKGELEMLAKNSTRKDF